MRITSPVLLLSLGLLAACGLWPRERHLVTVAVLADEAVTAETEAAAMRLKELWLPEKDSAFTIRVNAPGSFTVRHPGEAEPDVARRLAAELPGWSVRTSGEFVELALGREAAARIRQSAVEQAGEAIRRRLAEFATVERVQPDPRDGDRLQLVLRGLDKPEDARRLIETIGLLELLPVLAGPEPTEEAVMARAGGPALGSRVMRQKGTSEEIAYSLFGFQVMRQKGAPGNDAYFLVDRRPVITGARIQKARPSTDASGQRMISVQVDGEGARWLEGYTAAHLGQAIAIVLDGEVQSAPVIQSKISDSFIITGGFSEQEATDLALVLRSGALPVPVRVVETQKL